MNFSPCTVKIAPTHMCFSLMFNRQIFDVQNITRGISHSTSVIMHFFLLFTGMRSKDFLRIDHISVFRAHLLSRVTPSVAPTVCDAPCGLPPGIPWEVKVLFGFFEIFNEIMNYFHQYFNYLLQYLTRLNEYFTKLDELLTLHCENCTHSYVFLTHVQSSDIRCSKHYARHFTFY